MLRQVRDRQADMVQRMAMLNALNHCSARLNESLDQGETLNATAWLARQLTDADLTTVYLIEEGELRLKATSSSHEIPANRPPNATIDFEIQCGAHDVMAVDLLNTVIFDVNHQDVPIQVPRLALGYDAIEAVLCVPLRAGDVSLGKLTAVYFTPQQFPAYQVKMLQIFASHAGRAIQNAKLFEQIEAMTLSQERQRIACEMHDTMLQTLVTMNINLRVAIQQAHQAHWQEALPIFEEARRLGKVAVQEGRDTLNSLREDCYCNVQEADIRSIVQTEAGLFAQQAGIMPQIDVPAGIALPYRVVYQLQRLVGEALTNILRHADATHTSIQASVQDGVLCLRVVDNGKGFQPLRTTRPGSFGLLSMQERARLIDAEVMIDSLPGRGTTVEIRRPHPYPA
jgi:signal transduction histidine kinase